MFNNEDILTLAKAGFTAQQIAALNQVQQPVAPEVTTPPAQVTPEVTPPAQVQTPPAQVQTPPAQPTVAPHTVDDVLSAITGLSQQMQQNNLLNATLESAQPKTATEVLAQIINPPTKPKEV